MYRESLEPFYKRKIYLSSLIFLSEEMPYLLEWISSFPMTLGMSSF